MTGYLDTKAALWLAEAGGLLLSTATWLTDESEICLSRRSFCSNLNTYSRSGDSGCGRGTVCRAEFHHVINSALDEDCTRDLFDRVIVAHARTSGLAALITRDQEIHDHYPRAVW
jgi:PIN domain nuclease of toxin-antitoxin system